MFRQLGTMITSALDKSFRPWRVSMENPAEVCNCLPSAEQTISLNFGMSAPVLSLPKIAQGTERWNGLMPSKAITAIVLADKMYPRKKWPDIIY